MQYVPDFFIIGAPKCGTTTFYDWLSSHPHIHAPRKEPCFFSQDIYPTHALPTHIPSLEAYTQIYRQRALAHRVAGEATPKYLYSDLALQDIARLRPDARLIVCLRDPVDLVISLHNQKLKEGAEQVSDFEKAWRRAVAPDGRTVLSMAPTVHGQINYLFWGAFGSRLDRLHQLFPAENIRIFTLGELRDAPARAYADLLAFIGVEHDGRAEFSASNEGYAMRNPKLHLAVLSGKRALRPILRPIQKLRRGRGLGVLKLLKRWNTASTGYASAVPDALRSEIGEILADDTRLAERFLGGRRLRRLDRSS